MEGKFEVATSGSTRGAWYDSPNGLLSLVIGSNGAPSYVGAYTDNADKILPYALVYADNGELMLQIPKEERAGPADTLLIPVRKIAELVRAAKNL